MAPGMRLTIGQWHTLQFSTSWASRREPHHRARFSKQDGLEWEADQRHAELILSQLDLGKAKAVVTPGVKEEGKRKSEKDVEDEIVDFIQAQTYAAIGEETISYIIESDISEIMEDQGWSRTSQGSWIQSFEGARRMPWPRGVSLSRRVTRSRGGELMEDLDLSGRARRLDKRATRSLRWPMDIQAEVFVDGIEDEPSTDPNDRLLDAMRGRPPCSEVWSRWSTSWPKSVVTFSLRRRSAAAR